MHDHIHTCRAGIDKKVSAAVGAIVTLLVVAAGVVAFFLFRRRKRAKADAELKKQASAYAAWQDGLTGDEMQSTSTVPGGDAGQDGAMRAAAANAAHYVTKTGEEVLPDA
jgi:hypothetical protein